MLTVLAIDDRGFSELMALIPNITDRMLSRRLKELKRDGLIRRKVRSGPPIRVSYGLTEKGRGIQAALALIEKWAAAHY